MQETSNKAAYCIFSILIEQTLVSGIFAIGSKVQMVNSFVGDSKK